MSRYRKIRQHYTFFTEMPGVWQLPPERLCDGLIAVEEVMAQAIEVVVVSHVDTMVPIVIEGDGILPSLFARSEVRDRALHGKVNAVFLIEPEKDVLFANMVARSRGTTGRSEAELRTEVRAKWLYGQWLTEEARRYGLSVLEPRSWSTLSECIISHC